MWVASYSRASGGVASLDSRLMAVNPAGSWGAYIADRVSGMLVALGSQLKAANPSGSVAVYIGDRVPGVSLSLNPRLMAGIPPGCSIVEGFQRAWKGFGEYGFGTRRVHSH